MPVDRQREVNDMRNPVSGLPRRSLYASLPSWPDGRTVRIRDDLVASILFFGQLMMVCTAAVTWLTFGSSNVVASIFQCVSRDRRSGNLAQVLHCAPRLRRE